MSKHPYSSRSDNLFLVPAKPELERIESVDELQEADEGVHDVGDNVELKPLEAKRSLSTLQREFQLGDVLDYLKTGMASIIEDEVTQRFVAEELKSWNLMTRTNSQFEFINWKLTFLWLAGGFIRYFLLLPARLTILVIGVSQSENGNSKKLFANFRSS